MFLLSTKYPEACLMPEVQGDSVPGKEDAEVRLGGEGEMTCGSPGHGELSTGQNLH